MVRWGFVPVLAAGALVATGVVGAAVGARIGASALFVSLFVWLMQRLGLLTLAPSAFDDARRPEVPVAVPRPAGLQRVERFARSNLSAAEVHFEVRPVMRDVAAHRLRSRHGVELDRHPDRARELLGDSLFELVRGDRPVPADRQVRDARSAETVAGYVDALEAL